MANQYICVACNGLVKMTGEGLKTATCSKHPFRMVTVIRDFSGGKEADTSHQQTPVTVKRHTAVRIVRTKS